MNCWHSGKYVNLLHMYPILGRGFCFNYCLNSARHGGDRFVALLRWYGSPGFFDSGLQLICILWSLFSNFPQYPIDSLWGSGMVSLLASQAHQHHGHLTNFWWIWQCGQEPNPAGKNEISIFKKLVSRRKHKVLQNFLVNGCSDVGLKKTQWLNTNRWHCTPNHHRLWNRSTGLQATWAMSFFTLPPDSRTLVSKLNTKLALIWKEDFGPLGNSTVLLLLSPGKIPLMTTVAKLLDTSVCGSSLCLDPSLSPYLMKITQILESICLKILIRLRFSKLVVHLFLPHFFLPLNFLLTCLDTALCEQPASLAMNVCGLPSLWRVSMIFLWTTVRSAVFPMIV